MILRAFSVAALGLLAACAAGQPAPGEGSGSMAEASPAPRAALAGPDALTLPEYGVEPGPRQRFRQPLFERIACEAGPGETCRGRYRFDADDGYQICWMNYDLTTQDGRVRFVPEPASLLPAESGEPPRFTAQEVVIEAEGSAFSGARIEVEDGFFWLLALTADADDRRALGCRLPPAGR